MKDKENESTTDDQKMKDQGRDAEGDDGAFIPMKERTQPVITYIALILILVGVGFFVYEKMFSSKQKAANLPTLHEDAEGAAQHDTAQQVPVPDKDESQTPAIDGAKDVTLPLDGTMPSPKGDTDAQGMQSQSPQLNVSPQANANSAENLTKQDGASNAQPGVQQESSDSGKETQSNAGGINNGNTGADSKNMPENDKGDAKVQNTQKNQKTGEHAMGGLSDSITLDEANYDVGSPEFQAQVREYILKHPEIVAQSMEKLNKKKENKANEVVVKAQTEKQRDQATAMPFLGNSAGNATVIALFDYQCIHCKNGYKAISQIVNDKKSIKILLEPVPLMGPKSIKSARFALATWMLYPAKFSSIHEALFSEKSLDDVGIKKLCKKYGLNEAGITKKMTSPEVTNILDANLKKAKAIGLQGVPTYVINGMIVHGGLSYEQILQKISAD